MNKTYPEIAREKEQSLTPVELAQQTLDLWRTYDMARFHYRESVQTRHELEHACTLSEEACDKRTNAEYDLGLCLDAHRNAFDNLLNELNALPPEQYQSISPELRLQLLDIESQLTRERELIEMSREQDRDNDRNR